MSFNALPVHSQFKIVDTDEVLVKLGDDTAMTTGGKRRYVHPFEDIVRV